MGLTSPVECKHCLADISSWLLVNNYLSAASPFVLLHSRVIPSQTRSQYQGSEGRSQRIMYWRYDNNSQEVQSTWTTVRARKYLCRINSLLVIRFLWGKHWRWSYSLIPCTAFFDLLSELLNHTFSLSHYALTMSVTKRWFYIGESELSSLSLIT